MLTPLFKVDTTSRIPAVGRRYVDTVGVEHNIVAAHPSFVPGFWDVVAVSRGGSVTLHLCETGNNGITCESNLTNY